MSNGKKHFEQIQGFRKLRKKGKTKNGKRNILQIRKRATRKNDK